MSKLEELRGTGPAVFHPQVLGGRSTRVAESNAHCEGGCECGGADCPPECPCAANEDIQRPGGPSPNVANHKDEEMGMGEDDLEDREDEDDGDIFPSSKGEDDGEVNEPSNEDDGEIVAKKESLQMKNLRRLSESVLGEALDAKKIEDDDDNVAEATDRGDKALKIMKKLGIANADIDNGVIVITDRGVNDLWQIVKGRKFDPNKDNITLLDGIDVKINGFGNVILRVPKKGPTRVVIEIN